ncbi:uncharacterized protein B0H64DRAFT_56011 [Chaetomium fimeti]|uniref:Uncharacterized protein n=1 Tax=Chaetomium fimeti TaxID=1854472 RepID=A0AAE0H8A7_9PEZI|nr:hypothetical protein B0H64DRAFT_56011 [Chaetomium fimeti]
MFLSYLLFYFFSPRPSTFSSEVVLTKPHFSPTVPFSQKQYPRPGGLNAAHARILPPRWIFQLAHQVSELAEQDLRSMGGCRPGIGS